MAEDVSSGRAPPGRQPGGFEIVSSRRVYAGQVFDVRVDQVRIGEGAVFARETVEHRQSIVVVPVTEDRRVLMVRQTRIAAGGSLLETPAGNTEPEDESPDAAAQRELREETGQRARNLKRLGAQWVAPGYSTEWMHVYLATGLSPDPLPGDIDEDVTVESIPLEIVPRMIREGDIQDSMSISALLMTTCLFSEELPPSR